MDNSNNKKGKRASDYPVSLTGAEGTIYENWVQTYFFTVMILGGIPPFFRDGYKIYRIIPQYKRHCMGEDGPYVFETDDLVVFARNNNKEAKLLVNIKKDASVSTSSSEYNEVIKRAYRDILFAEGFNKQNDMVVLATRILDTRKSGILNILEIAKNYDSFEQAFNNRSLDNSEQRELKRIASILKNEEDFNNDNLMLFLKHFDILTIDLRTPIGVSGGHNGAMSLVLSLIKEKTKEQITQTPESTWRTLTSYMQGANGYAIPYELDNLPEDVSSFCKDTFKDIDIKTGNNDKQKELVPVALSMLGAIDTQSNGDIEAYKELLEYANE